MSVNVSWCGLISILGIILFIGIIVGLLTWKKNLWPLVVGLVVMVGIVVIWFMGTPSVIQQETMRRERNWYAGVELPPAASRVSSPLSGVMEAEFEPDIYPSLLSAIKGLIKKANAQAEAGGRLGTVSVSDAILSADREQVKALVQQLFGPQMATTSSSRPGGWVVNVHVDLKGERDNEANTISLGGEPGEIIEVMRTDKKFYLTMTVKVKREKGRASPAPTEEAGNETTLIYGAWFVEKPWVDNFAQYMMSGEGVKKFLMAQSGLACTSATEATQQAFLDAAKKLLLYVNASNLRFGLSKGGGDEELVSWIESYLRSDPAGRDLVRDQFIQSYKRPYGTIWSKSLLVDLYPENIQKLRNACQKEYYGGLMSTGYVLLSGVVLVGVICLLYWVVNSYTKGYYTWPLRTLSVLIVLSVVALVYYFMRTKAW